MTAPTPPDDEALARALHRSRVLEDAPEALILRSIGIFQAQPRAASPAAAASPAGLRQRLAAVLNFDSAMRSGAALGLRGGAGPTRQMLFSADGRDIDLRLQPAGDGQHWQLSGQVLGPDLQGTAELLAAGYSSQVDWDELAEFRFEQVPAGPCSLVLRTAAWELVLPGFEAGANDANSATD